MISPKLLNPEVRSESRITPPTSLQALIRSIPGEYATLGDLTIGRCIYSPEIAKRILAEHNTHNRKPIPSRISEIAFALTGGDWKFTGETLLYDWDAVLLNGQNRLSACAKSGKPLEALTVFGLSPDVFDVIDQGSKRSVGQVLSMSGEKNANIVGSAIVMFYRWGKTGHFSHGAAESYPVTMPFVERLIEEYPYVRETVTAIKNSRTATGMFSSPSTASALWLIFSMHSRERADEFFDRLLRMSFPEDEATKQIPVEWTPVQTLAARLVAERSHNKKARMTATYMAALIIKAWNFHLSRKGLITKSLKFDANVETFPQVKGWLYNTDGVPVEPLPAKE